MKCSPAVVEMAYSPILDRIRGAIYGTLIADALAAPSHWYYGGEPQVRQDYGRIEGYVKPKTKLAGSILNLSNTGGAGRGSSDGDIIGSVIYHGKKKFWEKGGDYHYHQSLEAGDNTLEALLMRRVVRVVGESEGKLDENAIRDDYVKFMTTPDTHNDTYCSTSHRMFFANWKKGVEAKLCPDNDHHNVDACDALTTSIPAALMFPEDKDAEEAVGKVVLITRNSPLSVRYGQAFAHMLRQIVLKGEDVRKAVEENAKTLGIRLPVDSSPDPVQACYMTQSYPAVLFMARKYAPEGGQKNQKAQNMAASEAFLNGVLANANRGGENVATGALIGALLGGACGYSNLPRGLIEGLAPSQRNVIDSEVAKFLQALPPFYEANL